MTLGTLMREKREELSLTKKEIAEQIDVTENTIMNWESDGHPPNPDKFGVIMDAYQIDRNTFAVTYLDTVCPEDTYEDEETKDENDLDIDSYDWSLERSLPPGVRPLSKSDFSDSFPLELYSDRMLTMLRELKFSAEEVDLWRMLDIYIDTEWYFTDCWEEHESSDISERYLSPVELVEYLPKDYVTKIGASKILGMIYDIQLKLPNSNVEREIDKWIVPDFTENPLLFQDEDVQRTYIQPYSVDGFDINDVHFYQLIQPWHLVDISPEEFHGLCNENEIFNRVTVDFQFLLELIIEGNNVVFEKDLTKTYDGYEYFNPAWWTAMISQMEECVTSDIENIHRHDSDEIKAAMKGKVITDDMTDAVKNRACYVDFWTKVIKENKTERQIGTFQQDDRLAWQVQWEPISSPFHDWVEFHYKKTDDKLICTASLTEKGVCLAADYYDWQAFINENMLNADVPDDARVPMNIYNAFLSALWEYIDNINHITKHWQTDSKYCEYMKEKEENIVIYASKLKDFQNNATHDMTFRDLKDMIQSAIFWRQTLNDFRQMLAKKAQEKQNSEDNSKNDMWKTYR